MIRRGGGLVIITALALFVSSVFAELQATSPESSSAGKLNIIVAESNLEKIQRSLTGVVVIHSTFGPMLETANGIYLLKGITLETLPGKKVRVRGLVQSNSKVNSIYVIEAAVLE